MNIQHRMIKQIDIEILKKILFNKKILYKIPIEDFLPNIDISNLDNVIICKIKTIYNIKTKEDYPYALAYIKNDNDDYPIFFIIYIDNKNRIRAYIPKHGNLYNPWCLCSFGNESILAYSRKSICLMPKQYYEFDKKDNLYKETQQYHKDFIKKHLHEHLDKMYNEFINLHTLVK